MTDIGTNPAGNVDPIQTAFDASISETGAQTDVDTELEDIEITPEAKHTDVPPQPEKPEPKDEEVKSDVTALKFKIDLGDGEKEYTQAEINKIVLDGRESKAAATKAFKEAYKLKNENLEAVKEAQKLLKLFEDQPDEFVKSIRSKDPVKAKELLLKEIDAILEEESMDPKDKRIKELESKQEKIDREEREASERVAKEQSEKETQQNMIRYAKEIDDALVKANLPTDKKYRSMVNYYLGLAAETGDNLTADEVMPYVVRDMKNLIKDFLVAAPDLTDYVDDKILGRIRELDKARVETTKGKTPRQPGNAKPFDKKPTSQPTKAENDKLSDSYIDNVMRQVASKKR